jgi:hypothetical protein
VKTTRIAILIAALALPIGTANADVGMSSRPAYAPVSCCVGETTHVVMLVAPHDQTPLASQQIESEQPEPGSLHSDTEQPAADRSMSSGRVDPLDGGMGRLNSGPCSNSSGPLSLPAGASSSETAVRMLPELPGSANLFMSALLSAGAWHMVRRAGQLHLAHLPAWYHPDAPQQIGHSVAFEPSLGFELLAVCAFEAPLPARPVPSAATLRELPSRHESQHFLPVQAPRGPPLRSY